MIPALVILAAWFLFAGTHLGLSASNARARFSPKAFVILFGLISTFSLLPLIVATVVYGGEGMSGPQLGRFMPLRWLFGALALSGAILIAAGLLNYQRSPMAKLARATGATQSKSGRLLKPPGAIDQITRHPFFVGLGLLASVHVLLASTLATAMFFVGLAAICFVGIPLQDAKLRARWSEEYSDYEASTGVVPFSTRNRTEAQEGSDSLRPWVISIALGAGVVGLLHPFWSWGNGAAFLAAILFFGSVSIVAGVLRGNHA